MKTMAQRLQQPRSHVSDDSWLATLVDTFERTERLGSVPCSSEAMSVLRARLSLPAMVNGESIPAGKLVPDEEAVTRDDAVQLDHHH